MRSGKLLKQLNDALGLKSCQKVVQMRLQICGFKMYAILYGGGVYLFAYLDKAIAVVAFFLVGSHLRESFRFREWIGKNSVIDLREFFKRDPKIAPSRFRVFRFKFVDSN